MSGSLVLMMSAGGISVRLNPAVAIGFGVGTVTTNQSIVSTVTGGAAPYTYSWTSFEPTIYPTSPNGSFSFFRRDDVQPGETYAATVHLTVTDAVGKSASAEANVNITGL